MTLLWFLVHATVVLSLASCAFVVAVFFIFAVAMAMLAIKSGQEWVDGFLKKNGL